MRMHRRIRVAHRRLRRLRVGAVRSDRTRRCDADANRDSVAAPRSIHPRIRSSCARWIPTCARTTPGTCRRCGMNLVAGIPDPVEFHLDLEVLPRPPQARRTRGAAVPDSRPLEGPSRRQLQRRSREALSRLRRERGSAVLQARAPDVCRRRRLPAADHVSEGRHVSRARRFLSRRRDAAAERTQTIFVPATSPAPVHARARLLPRSRARTCACRWSRSRSRRSRAMRTQLRFTIDPGGRAREVPRRVGAHAGGEQRSDRHDAPASVSRGRGARWSNSRWCFRGRRSIACGSSSSATASSIPSTSTCPSTPRSSRLVLSLRDRR